MATKIYTAQEMREEAKCFEMRGGSGVIPAMLRQAADALEREEKRVKKYEYAALWGAVDISHIGCSMAVIKRAIEFNNKLNMRKGAIVRRPVGEWEEVKE